MREPTIASKLRVRCACVEGEGNNAMEVGRARCEECESRTTTNRARMAVFTRDWTAKRARMVVRWVRAGAALVSKRARAVDVAW